MVQILGLVDIIVALMLTARVYHWQIPILMLVFIGIILIGKALLSITNFFGWIDLAALILIIFGSFLNHWVLIIAAVIMGIKGLVSVLTTF